MSDVGWLIMNDGWRILVDGVLTNVRTTMCYVRWIMMMLLTMQIHMMMYDDGKSMRDDDVCC